MNLKGSKCSEVFPQETSHRVKQEVQLFELVFSQDVLYFPSNSPVAFTEVLKRSEDENAASIISGLQQSVLLLYQWQLLREEQIKL